MMRFTLRGQEDTPEEEGEEETGDLVTQELEGKGLCLGGYQTSTLWFQAEMAARDPPGV